MSLFIQPSSLHRLTKSHVHKLLVKACLQTEQTYGSYDNHSCKEQLNTLQTYFNSIRYSTDNFSSIMTGVSVAPRRLTDKRIFISMFMQADATIYCNIIDAILYRPITEEEEKQYRRYMDFFVDKLQYMSNLIKLDLSLIRDVHELFDVIGKNCHKLEELKLNSSQDIKYRHDHLLQLVACPQLHRIDDENNFYNYEPTSIVRLIKLHPSLRYFNVLGLGEILSRAVADGDITTPLALTCAYEEDTSPEHVRALAKYCPRLEILKMINVISSNPDEIINTLSECLFPLNHLELEAYSMHKIVNAVLPRQGEFLTALMIKDRESNVGLTKRDILMIGKYCQKLRTLYLHMRDIRGADHDYDIAEVNNDLIDPDVDNQLFKNLQSLSLIDAVTFTDGMISLFLKNATEIQTIVLREYQSSEWNSTGGALIGLANPMSKLDHLSIECVGSVELSIYDVSALYNKFSCVAYVNVLVSFMEADAVVRVEEIRRMIRDNNYQTKFRVRMFLMAVMEMIGQDNVEVVLGEWMAGMVGDEEDYDVEEDVGEDGEYEDVNELDGEN